MNDVLITRTEREGIIVESRLQTEFLNWKPFKSFFRILY